MAEESAGRYVFVTFKVTRDGERGHPMDHVLTRVDVDADGMPAAESLEKVMLRVAREVRRHAPTVECPWRDDPAGGGGCGGSAGQPA